MLPSRLGSLLFVSADLVRVNANTTAVQHAWFVRDALPFRRGEAIWRGGGQEVR